MFWGLVLEPSKKYTQKVDQTFHISQAALDLKSCDHAEPIQLVVEYENSSFVLATLSKKANIFQVPLDLIFRTGDQVSFRTIGNGKVHLSGYHVLEDIDSIIMNGEEESDLDEIKETDKGKGKRKKLTPKSKGSKKAKLDSVNEDGSDEDDDFDVDDSEDDEEDNTSIAKKTGKGKQTSDLSLGSMDDDDDDDDDEDEDDLDEEEDYEDIDMDEELEDEEFNFDSSDDENENDESEDNVKAKSPKSEGNKTPQTPNGLSSGKKGKDKSFQKEKETPGKEMKKQKNETKQKGEKNQKSSAESTPQRKSAEKSKSPKSEGTPQKKVLEGGVISEDIKVGSGPMAKPGKMANVYYVGTLAATKKQFDSVQSGAGFKFRVGRNEVIKGWDIGVIGMKVGGKRRLTIPSHLAYGSKGSPPVIPPNATLMFTVELKGLS